ncbi:MAG TPA: zinc ribbon domain-containing protein [Armatimonadota bacterium]|nr:zinc ribbon domain-containing protein [Armatimonadota bacterium]
MYCKNCGREMADDATFCSACGAGQQPTPQPAQSGSGRGATCWIIGCVALFALAVLAAVGIWLGVRYLQSEPQPDNDLPVISDSQLSPTDDIEPDQVRPPDLDEPLIGGGSEGTPGGGEQPSSGDEGVDPDWEAAVTALVDFFHAMERGDMDAMKATMTPQLAGEIDPELIAGGYESAGFNIDGQRQLDANSWEFLPTIKVNAADGSGIYTYSFRIKVMRTTSGWKLATFYPLEDE